MSSEHPRLSRSKQIVTTGSMPAIARHTSTQVRAPVVFMAFANNRVDMAQYLRNLPEEQRRLRRALEPAQQAGLCEVVERAGTTLQDLLDVFQNPLYRDRIAIFHFGGHAGSDRVLLESNEGARADAHAGGLAELIGQQQGLALVFLNGCSSRGQVEGLLEAGVSAVIATSQAIDDAVATLFSERFYTSMASGAGLRTAYNEATAAAKAARGQAANMMYRDLEEEEDEGREAPNDDRWPWELHLNEGAGGIEAWSLPEAAQNPLFGLPDLPPLDLPESPYRHLRWYTRDQAEVFFGRGAKIRELHQAIVAPDSAPIILFYGSAGAGKSSVLDAGLLPRLEHHHDVRYLRRDRTLGLVGTLGSLFDTESPEGIRAAWRAEPVEGHEAPPPEPVVTDDILRDFKSYLARQPASARSAWGPLIPVLEQAARVEVERQTSHEQHGGDRSLVVILDQLEEAYTRPRFGELREMRAFIEALTEIFGTPRLRPPGKLVLSFRKEWLAEILGELKRCRLPYVGVELRHLEREDIVEAISGPMRSERLQRAFNLHLEPELAGIIADDLLEDRDAAIAPTLQILLSRLWERAQEDNPGAPLFTIAMYQEMKKEGLLLEDFIDKQFEVLREWCAPLVDSGLVLDLLSQHTTPMGTAEARPAEALLDLYHHQSALMPGLLQQLKDCYLLTEAVSSGTSTQGRQTLTRLAHDTLAPIIRHRHESSDLPGQRAARVLQQRAQDKDGAKHISAQDLLLIEAGQPGMRVWSEAETLLIESARKSLSRAQRLMRVLRVSLMVAAVVMTVGSVAVSIVVSNAREQAEAQNELAQKRLARVLRLSDAQRLDGLVEAADTLWPALPARIPAYEKWLGEARTLLAHQKTHLGYLDELKAQGQPDKIQPYGFRFDTHEAQWEHDTMAQLVEGLVDLDYGLVGEIEARLEDARTIKKRSIEDHKADWDKAAEAIAAHPSYEGLRIKPQMGLVPIGPDPTTGLWEFAHLQSGQVPQRDEHGRIRPNENMGVVLILIPGGTFYMGAERPSRGKNTQEGALRPNLDPNAGKHEGPTHEVTLAPFFISRYEMTQGQWTRFTGKNPSSYLPGRIVGGKVHSLLHPVEQMTWDQAWTTVSRLGLTLPTEAQWEYAARAGTRTVYWTGDTLDSLQGALNIADNDCKLNGGPGSWHYETTLSDGYVAHAPVGRFRPNPFGLHDVAGNVWEWCRDRYGPYTLPVAAGTGARQTDALAPRIFRGGGYRANRSHARAADRYQLTTASWQSPDVGLRPARRLVESP